MIVLLLCLAVQRKPNEDVISRITTLDFDTQHDIMYFIEEALAKINSNALSTGNFTSGQSLGTSTPTHTHTDHTYMYMHSYMCTSVHVHVHVCVLCV